MIAMFEGIDWWLSHPAVQQLGWVLVHFVWQGTLVAGLLAGALALLRADRARLRYALSLAALVMLLTLPAVTWLVLPGSSPAPTSAASLDVPPSDVSWMLLATPSDVTPAASWTETVRSGLAAGLPWGVAGWLAGVSVLALRLLGGWAYTIRLRRAHAGPVPPDWQRRADALAERLGVRARVDVHQSAHIDVPMVIGWMRPVVLVPVSVFTGLPPAQVEALLAHELAHIRRYDVLVGRLQAVAETLLFYHPAVWWVSRQVCIEREHCCDDLVVQTFHDRLSYARALTTLAARHVGPPVGAMAATGGTLLARIRRLVGQAPAQEERGARSSVSIALLGVAVGLAVVGLQFDTPEASEEGVHRAALMSWVPGKVAFMDIGEARGRGVPPVWRDTTERKGAPPHPASAPHPQAFWFRSDSAGDFSVFAPGLLDSLDRQVNTFVWRYRDGLDTIPLPPIPDVPLVMPPDSLPAIGVPPPAPFLGMLRDTIDFGALRGKLDSLRVAWPRVQASLDSLDWARIDSLRRAAHAHWQTHREEARRLMEERREEIERLRREMHERMREEHPERLREQAEMLRRQAEKMEERARQMEEGHEEGSE